MQAIGRDDLLPAEDYAEPPPPDEGVSENMDSPPEEDFLQEIQSPPEDEDMRG
jgi:hypothetical protein